MQLYRLLMPARALDWGSAAFEGLFYGLLNLILSLPILIPVNASNLSVLHPVWFHICWGIVLLVFPILWPCLLVFLHKKRLFTRWVQLPYPTAWDFLFDQRPEAFVLLHLKSGEKIGGYYGAGSYASAYPHEGDIYIELVYKVDENGMFQHVIPNTRGLLVRKDEYSHIEVFNLPKQ